MSELEKTLKQIYDIIKYGFSKFEDSWNAIVDYQYDVWANEVEKDAEATEKREDIQSSIDLIVPWIQDTAKTLKKLEILLGLVYAPDKDEALEDVDFNLDPFVKEIAKVVKDKDMDINIFFAGLELCLDDNEVEILAGALGKIHLLQPRDEKFPEYTPFLDLRDELCEKISREAASRSLGP